MDIFSNIAKNGTAKQLKALENLGKTDLTKIQNMEQSVDAGKLLGDLADLKDTDISMVMDEKTIEEFFDVLDGNNDGKLSEEEVNVLANAGKDGETGKIDASDIKDLIESAAKAKASASVQINSKTGEKTETVKIDDYTKRVIVTDKFGEFISSVVTTENADGSKTEEITLPDGSKTEIKYDKQGNITEETKTLANGQVENTKYKYDEYGNKISSETVITRKNEEGEEYVYRNRTAAYKDGKISNITETDADGGKISETSYIYDNNGKLLHENKKSSDGTTSVTFYDEQGNKSNQMIVGANGKISSRIAYNTSGIICDKIEYLYDENGVVSQTYRYGFDKDGEVKNRTEYAADGKTILSTSTYEYILTKDGQEKIRKDTDPQTNLPLGGERYGYDSYGQLLSTFVIDKDGNEISCIGNNYDKAGVLISQDKYIYETDENGIYIIREDKGMDGTIDNVIYNKFDEIGKVTEKSYDLGNDGTINKILKFEYDEKGQVKRQYTDESGNGKFDFYQDYDPVKKQFGNKIEINN